ncbi:unnamed protein product [Parnassius mnemosyne]|uniref:HAT C-terminal dimerisation domain-containing protein n=1 Tax=Parnassius mnemosyne TaxID=213953 RepID=A0AAV1LTF3_9NEOP
MNSEEDLPPPSSNSSSTPIAFAAHDIDSGKDEIWGVVDQTNENYGEQTCDPLQFWNEKKCLYPVLFKIAHKYLCIPATSVPSECLFSKTGILCNDRRNRLAPKKVDQILFLNSIQ